MNKFISLYLDGPMQSWGYMSKFDQRTSLAYPTKSGVCGMLCAAIGIARSEKDKLADLTQLGMTVFVLTPLNRVVDFHTVGGGYDKSKSSYDKQSIVTNAKGKTGNTVVTRREYLLDAKFAVVLEGDPTLILNLELAMKNPKWGVWLGRKSCVPTVPISQGCHENIGDALEAAKLAYRKTYGKDCEVRKNIADVSNFADGSDSFMDTPLDFEKREFSLRRVALD